jgi:hypothetical protein
LLSSEIGCFFSTATPLSVPLARDAIPDAGAYTGGRFDRRLIASSQWAFIVKKSLDKLTLTFGFLIVP